MGARSEHRTDHRGVVQNLLRRTTAPRLGGILLQSRALVWFPILLTHGATIALCQPVFR
jgi:hypothetical protein